MQKLVITLLSLICLWVQQDPFHKDVEYGDPTRFELLAGKATYYVGEPTRLVVTLYNDRDRPIKGYFNFTLMEGLWVYHRKEGREFIRYFPQWMQILSTSDVITFPIKIPEQGKLENELKLFYNTYYKQFVLAEVGDHEIKARLNLGNDRVIESNIVRVRVIEPPAEQREALAMLSDPQLASFIEGDLRTGLVEDIEVEAGAEKALLFLEKHSRSLYAAMVEDQLRAVLTEAEARGELTPKLQTLKTLLPDK